MNIVVFGSTGPTGKQLIALLVHKGYNVTAFARSPDKVDTFGGKVAVIQGDARDPAAVAGALKHQDIVMSTLGTRLLKKNDTQEVFMRNLIAGMDKLGIKRLVELSARGAGDSAKETNLFVRLFQHTLLKNTYDDKNKAEDLLSASDLNYTKVRPPRLTDKPAKGGVRASLVGKGLSQSIARADVAAFMVDQLEDSPWIRKSPLIGY